MTFFWPGSVYTNTHAYTHVQTLTYVINKHLYIAASFVKKHLLQLYNIIVDQILKKIDITRVTFFLIKTLGQFKADNDPSQLTKHSLITFVLKTCNLYFL